MSRNVSGTYTLPSGNPVVSGTLIEATWANDTLSDLATAMTESLSREGEGGMNAALRLVDGTVSVPGAAFSNETTTGFYRAGAGDWRFAVTGSDILKLLSSGVTVTGALSATSLAGAFNGTVGATTPSTGDFTAVNATSVGATTPGTGAFTSLSGTSFTVDGTGKAVTLGSTTAVNFYAAFQYNAVDCGYLGNGAGVVAGAANGDFGIAAVAGQDLWLGSNNGAAYVHLTSAGALTLTGVNVVTESGTQTLTNKTLTTPVIASISNSGTITVPTGTDTLVGRATTDTLTNKTLTAAILDGGYSEEVFALGTSGSLALDPANGSIQTCAAVSAVTFTDSLAAGESIIVMVSGGQAITFPTMTWVTNAGNVEPTLAGSDTFVFWKISTTLYGAYVGSYA